MGNVPPVALLPYTLHECAAHGYVARMKYLLDVMNVPIDGKDDEVCRHLPLPCWSCASE